MTWTLYDGRGRRKYLVQNERREFLRVALKSEDKVASFCLVLAFCGARISEVLSLTSESIDDANLAINFRTLKRRKLVVRAVPVPRKLLQYLNRVHGYRRAALDAEGARERLWPWSRTTAWRRVKEILKLALGPGQSSPKSLRHSFGAEAAIKGIGLPMIQKWLGHASIRTTAIYTTLVGKEERALASKIWPLIEPKARPRKRKHPL